LGKIEIAQERGGVGGERERERERETKTGTETETATKTEKSEFLQGCHTGSYSAQFKLMTTPVAMSPC
jgi:hypothetical protein